MFAGRLNNGGVVSCTVTVAHSAPPQMTLPADALIVTVPGPFACTRPNSLTLAIDGLALSQCTFGPSPAVIRTREEPSLKWPVAANDCVPPGASVAEDGDTVIDWRATGAVIVMCVVSDRSSASVSPLALNEDAAPLVAYNTPSIAPVTSAYRAVGSEGSIVQASAAGSYDSMAGVTPAGPGLPPTA